VPVPFEHDTLVSGNGHQSCAFSALPTRSLGLVLNEKIAEPIRSLTYGETIELASELGKTAGKTVQIDKIAELIRSLTYGEMIEFASALQEAAG
jgi:hypothetical protein